MQSRIWKILAFLAALLPAAYAQVSVTTSRNNNFRDGQNLKETILTPANVNAATFGKLFSQTVDGVVYAQPLYVPNVRIPGVGIHNVVYVATENDSVYAFDADSNTGMNASPLWQRSFIDPENGVTPVSYKDVNCPGIFPIIGITSTPVIDTDTRTMYVLAITKENGNFVQRLHALDIRTGAERWNSPTVIQASVEGSGESSINGVISFDPLHEGQRPGLLLQNGSVIISWASYCDNPPYHGWVMSYNATTLDQIAVWNTTPNGEEGGIWQSGTGLAADLDFNIFIATGNGTYDGKTGGDDFSDSIVKLVHPRGRRCDHFRVDDWFTPYNQVFLSSKDLDVGSGGVLLLPDQGERAPHRRLLVQVGKMGSIYLVDRDHMGYFNPNNNDQIVQDLEGALNGMWATPGWWNNNVYFGAENDYMKQYAFDPATGLLSTVPIAVSATLFGSRGSTPSISANGTKDAIVWVVQWDDFGKGPATLHAYDANNIATEFYNSDQIASRDDPGIAVKFSVPTVANGKVYVPAIFELSVFGLLP
jgi:hypothetical protein